MLVTTELRSRAWRSNAASVRLRRSNHTATGRPTSSTPTSRTNRSPRDDVIVERKVSIGYPFGIGRSYPLMDVRYSSTAHQRDRAAVSLGACKCEADGRPVCSNTSGSALFGFDVAKYHRKDPAPFSTLGAIHRWVGHASMAKEIPFVGRSMEYEGIVDKLHSRQFLCVHH